MAALMVLFLPSKILDTTSRSNGRVRSSVTTRVVVVGLFGRSAVIFYSLVGTSYWPHAGGVSTGEGLVEKEAGGKALRGPTFKSSLVRSGPSINKC